MSEPQQSVVVFRWAGPLPSVEPGTDLDEMTLATGLGPARAILDAFKDVGGRTTATAPLDDEGAWTFAFDLGRRLIVADLSWSAAGLPERNHFSVRLVLWPGLLGRLRRQPRVSWDARLEPARLLFDAALATVADVTDRRWLTLDDFARDETAGWAKAGPAGEVGG